MADQSTQPTTQSLQIPPEIQTFLENILQDANMTTLDADTKDGMIQELFQRLDQFITSEIVDAMPEEKLEAFIQMNEQKKPKQEIEQYLLTNLPNAQQVMQEAFVKFRNLYLGNVSVARNAPTEEPDK